VNYKRRNMFFDVKTIKKDGSFGGYGSVFGNQDAYNDVVMPGAFAKSLADWAGKNRLPPVLWQHDATQPLGPFTSMSEDGTGLYVEGQLLVNSVQRAAEAYALLDAKAINGMSIGYNIVEADYDSKNDIMKLSELDLWEVSIATFPANQSATITELKQICAGGELPTLRVFEGLLRDAGFSRKQAADVARAGLVPLLQREADGNKSVSDEASLIDQAVALIQNIPVTF
jgi:HK97 family phage prohead protease